MSETRTEIKSSTSLAVKHRPRLLDQMIGQESTVAIIKQKITSESGLDRSMLITGSTGCGKTTLARIIAHYVNCQNFNFDFCVPCMECEYCEIIQRRWDNNSTSFPDVEEVNFSDTRGIDTVRNIITAAEYAPNYNARVFILDEVHMMTTQGQNALLKLLEEPPEGIYIILLTTDPHKLLPTIKNRCTLLPVSNVDEVTLADHLYKVSSSEKHHDVFVEAGQEELAFKVYRTIAKASDGFVRTSLSALDSILAQVSSNILSLEDATNPDKLAAAVKDILGDTSITLEDEFGKFLIYGIYSGTYTYSLEMAAYLCSKYAGGKIRYFIDKVTAYNRHTLYFFLAPVKLDEGVFPHLADSYYAPWRASLKEYASKDISRRPLKVTHKSLLKIQDLFLQMSNALSLYQVNEIEVVSGYVCRMVEAVHEHAHEAYTVASAFHKQFGLIAND